MSERPLTASELAEPWEERWEEARLSRLADAEEKRAAIKRQAQRIATEDRVNWSAAQAARQAREETEQIAHAPYYLSIIGTFAGNAHWREIEGQTFTEEELRECAENERALAFFFAAEGDSVKVAACVGRETAYALRLSQLQGKPILLFEVGKADLGWFGFEAQVAQANKALAKKGDGHAD